jgi:hypothetical protein
MEITTFDLHSADSRHLVDEAGGTFIRWMRWHR